MLDMFQGEGSAWQICLTAGVAAIACAQFLDMNLTTEWKAKVANLLRTGGVTPLIKAEEGAPWQRASRALSSFFGAVFQARSRYRFIKTSVVLSLTIISAVFAYYLLKSDEAFRAEMLQIVTTPRSLFLALLLPLLGTLFIDIIAAYQTLLFLELVGKCRAFWQVIVLAYGNIFLSIGLFSVAFPIVVVCIMALENTQKYTGRISFQPVPARQTDGGKRHAVLVTFGRETYNEIVGNIAKVNESRLALWRLDAAPVEKTGEARLSHSMTLVASSNLKAESLYDFLGKAYAQIGEQIKVTNAESRPGMFMSSYEVELETKNLFRELSWSTIYSVAFRDSTLLGERSLELVSSTPVTINADSFNTALSNELIFVGATRDKPDFFTFCDGSISRVTKFEPGAITSLGQCKVWAAVATAALEVEASLLMTRDSSKIFITPFAWSSLSTTITIYFVCFILIYAFVIRSFVPMLFRAGVLDIEKRPLTCASLAAFVFLILPVTGVAFLLF